MFINIIPSTDYEYDVYTNSWQGFKSYGATVFEISFFPFPNNISTSRIPRKGCLASLSILFHPRITNMMSIQIPDNRSGATVFQSLKSTYKIIGSCSSMPLTIFCKNITVIAISVLFRTRWYPSILISDKDEFHKDRN